MNVYIVSTGEYGEGSYPARAFRDIWSAKAWVRAKYQAEPVSIGGGTWRFDIGRADVVWIHRMKVHE